MGWETGDVAIILDEVMGYMVRQWAGHGLVGERRRRGRSPGCGAVG